MRISKTVAEALAAGKPIVALESTIISHGLPSPCKTWRLPSSSKQLIDCSGGCAGNDWHRVNGVPTRWVES